MARAARRVNVVDNRRLARQIGERIRRARRRAGLTQREVAQGRYTAAYISALELGHAKPSMAAMTFIAERLGVATTEFLTDQGTGSQRLEADLALASGDAQRALDGYRRLLQRAVGDQDRADLLRGMAEALGRLRRPLEAIAPAAEAAQLYRSMNRGADAVEATYWLAYAQYQQDNLAEARSLLTDIIEQVRGGLEMLPDFMCRLLIARANVEIMDGEFQAGLGYMEEARALSAGLDIRRHAMLLAGLALSYREAGDLEASLTAGNKSLALYRVADAAREEASLTNNLALTHLRLGNHERAAELLESARTAAEHMEDRVLLAHVTDSEAQLALARDDLGRAEALVTAAIAAAEGLDNHLALANAQETASSLARRQGRIDAAADHLERAISILRRHGPQSRLRDLLAALAALRRDEGDLATATELYEEALRLHR